MAGSPSGRIGSTFQRDYVDASVEYTQVNPINTCEKLTDALDSVCKASVFESQGHTISSTQMRNAYASRSWNDQHWLLFERAELRLPGREFSTLVERLDLLLEEFRQPGTDHIGNGLFTVLGGGPGRLALPTIGEFAEMLTGAAIKLGAPRVAELLLGWIAGDPIQTRECALLEGVSIEADLALAEGIELIKLPTSSEHLAATLPDHGVSASDYLGGVVLSVVRQHAPALYAPDQSGEVPNVLLVPVGTVTGEADSLPKLGFDTFCESMSLACGEYVGWRRTWTDYGELEAFTSGIRRGSHKAQSLVAPTRFSQQDLDRAREIHLVRFQGGASRQERDVGVAIGRWMKSKRSMDPSDSLIDLRIAIEALYGRGAMNELAFRASTYSAWHLGETAVERQEIRDTIKKAYDDASRAIHAGKLKFAKADRELLPAAQEICRRGIVKRLGEKEPPRWEQLILGC